MGKNFEMRRKGYDIIINLIFCYGLFCHFNMLVIFLEIRPLAALTPPKKNALYRAALSVVAECGMLMPTAFVVLSIVSVEKQYVFYL